MTSLKLRYVALTDTGLRRSTNQDSGYASDRLIAIADGMGGAAAGDLASASVMNVIRELDRDLSDVDPLQALGTAVQAANDRLGELIVDDPAVEGMGTTLEAMLWDGHRFARAHIGDSRAYLLRDGELTQVSTDHTFVQSLVEEGKLTKEEARIHPHRSLLRRVLLGRDDNAPDLDYVEGRLGDRFLLCSDGLSDMVEDDVIAEALAAETIDMAATELVRLALEAGGYDNVTVVIGELVDASEDPDEHLSSSDGRPQLVGAAAGGPRGRTGHEAGHGTEGQHLAVDPEELRYAPRPPGRMRWFRRILAIVVIIGALVVAGVYAYSWSQDQYFVAAHDGKVTIYKGVEADLPGITLKHVDAVTDVSVDTLPGYLQKQVREGIEASSRDDATTIVNDLQQLATPKPSPSPSPSPSASPTKKKS
ncbi:PP2C family protein-serine/threonine phosphatase [Aeromicrobium terrae]|uniref:Serine/threonine-protein phosphatase n=1 Tax=Aeromicrobium terrae TaxID=2498846 RepID=A0A5C8NH15_9ACTN|nr:BofC C-terminal domain-containing protein [Aeromicrobium terrae]TXL57436.1 serine/threonine-protein phosphatase [Aeromicrobium terrae]